MNTIYRVTDSEYVVTINPLVMGSLDQAGSFADAQAVADSLSQSEGVAFRIGRPKDRQ